MHKRAKKGGEIGINGERYRGGEFLPSTRLPSRGTNRQSSKVRRGLTEPGRVEALPEGKNAIFAAISAVTVPGGESGRDPLPATHAYWTSVDAMSRDFVLDLCSRYNAGERFF